MKRTAAIVILFFALASAGLANTLVKAREFIKAGKYPQAIELLTKEITENPANDEAQFELGSVYFTQAKYPDAEKRFAEAFRLKADYGSRISGLYKTVGLQALERGSLDEGRRYLFMAVRYQPDLRGPLAADLVTRAKTLVQQGTYGMADVRFLAAASLDPKYMQETCDLYLGLGDKADDDNCLGFYSKARPFCSGSNEKVGNRLLAISKTLSKKGGMEKSAEDHKKLGSKYMK